MAAMSPPVDEGDQLVRNGAMVAEIINSKSSLILMKLATTTIVVSRRTCKGGTKRQSVRILQRWQLTNGDQRSGPPVAWRTIVAVSTMLQSRISQDRSGFSRRTPLLLCFFVVVHSIKLEIKRPQWSTSTVPCRCAQHFRPAEPRLLTVLCQSVD